jgi:methylase of polypeptide subunit release factors
VLIPRNDTEVMVEKVLDSITEKTDNTILIDV